MAAYHCVPLLSHELQRQPKPLRLPVNGISKIHSQDRLEPYQSQELGTIIFDLIKIFTTLSTRKHFHYMANHFFARWKLELQ